MLFLSGSSKTTPRILIFSIAMSADYSFYVKSIAICALTFLGCIISVLASVSQSKLHVMQPWSVLALGILALDLFFLEWGPHIIMGSN